MAALKPSFVVDIRPTIAITKAHMKVNEENLRLTD